MRTKVLCTSCEEYVYTDADHSCHDAKALRAVRDAEAAVVEAAVAFHDVTVSPRLATLGEYIAARETMSTAVRALRAVRGAA
jgi:putative intracellular protease/amidase